MRLAARATAARYDGVSTRAALEQAFARLLASPLSTQSRS